MNASNFEILGYSEATQKRFVSAWRMCNRKCLGNTFTVICWQSIGSGLSDYRARQHFVSIKMFINNQIFRIFATASMPQQALRTLRKLFLAAAAFTS